MADSEVRVGKRARGKKQQEEWPSTPFYGILRHLCDEHEREVSSLQRKVEDLQAHVLDEGDELETKAPDRPRTLQPAPPKDDAAQLVVVHDSSVVDDTAACPHSRDISGETEEPILSMQTLSSTSLFGERPAVDKRPPSMQPSSQAPSALSKKRPLSANAKTPAAMSVPGLVEEFTAVSPTDLAAVSLHRFQMPQAVTNGTSQRRKSALKASSRVPSNHPIWRQDDSKLGALFPQPGALKVCSAEASAEDPGSNDEAPNRCGQNSFCSAALGISSRSDVPPTGVGQGESKPTEQIGSCGLQEQLNFKQSTLAGSARSNGIKELAPSERMSKELPPKELMPKDLESKELMLKEEDRNRASMDSYQEVLSQSSSQQGVMFQCGVQGDQPQHARKKKGGSILRSRSQFELDTSTGSTGRKSDFSRRISWAHGMRPDDDEEEVPKKKSGRGNYKVMDIWKSEEDKAALQRMSSSNKTRGVTRLSGAMMAIQKTFQTMGFGFDRKGTWDESGSNLPSDCQKVLIELDCRINRRGLERFVSDPNSAWRFSWDLFTMLIIAYDFITVPLTLFDVSDNSFMMGMTIFTATFWSINILQSFFTGFLRQGDVVMAVKDIALHYMRTWLLPDLLITLTQVVDITFHYSSEDDDLSQILKVIRTLQLLRGLKALRIVKAIEERITRERYSVAFKLVKFFTCILMVNHLIACLWYGIGESHRGKTENWLEAYLKDEVESLGYCYATSFHWALTQFTPASIEVQPRNSLERFFAIIVLLFALVTVSSFISGITGAVMELRNLAAVKSKQFWLLRRYMSESSVPTELALRVQHYLDFAWRMREHRLLEGNVEVLSLLSAALKAQLNTAIYEPRISVHPLFVLIGKMATFIMQRLCNTAVTRIFSIQGDSIFSVNTSMSKMFVIHTGELEYQLDATGKPEQVKPGKWVCEPALWTEWSTHGALVAQKDCEIISVDAACFGAEVKTADEVWIEAVNYARGFIQGLNRMDKSRLTDLFQSNLIEGLWFRLLNDWNVRGRPTLQNGGLDFDGRCSTVSLTGTAMHIAGAGLKNIEE